MKSNRKSANSFLCVLCALALVVTAAGCGSKDESASNAQTPAASDTVPKVSSDDTDVIVSTEMLTDPETPKIEADPKNGVFTDEYVLNHVFDDSDPSTVESVEAENTVSSYGISEESAFATDNYLGKLAFNDGYLTMAVAYADEYIAANGITEAQLVSVRQHYYGGTDFVASLDGVNHEFFCTDITDDNNERHSMVYHTSDNVRPYDTENDPLLEYTGELPTKEDTVSTIFGYCDPADVTVEDVEVSQSVDGSSIFMSDRNIANLVNTGNYYMATLVNYMDNMISEMGIQDVEIFEANPSIISYNELSASMSFDGVIYDFYVLETADTPKGQVTVFWTHR